ncbi:FAD-dependent oxidoreductase [Sporosalibacterium faouarense]|uniref:FAD-dependent oxidoreductase n=1 Tax=Sporosalibacterium faouarense TaxID=516123 RepID=UPI00141CFF5E|nr:FAD-dependent oxidoreductase [Sporosalibacterium faouarense]MTI49628.1 FAD-dependent oxidoreductase [Bacillota bacterium]
MNIAIIGGGIAGLSCAHELERHGIVPTIYERNGFIGEQYEHVSAILEILHRPIKDAPKYFYDKFNIKIEPINTVNSLVHYSPHITTTIKGNFGYFFHRGKNETAFKPQLLSQLKKTKIIFNENADYKVLLKKYDYVVIANGSSNFTEELGCYQHWVNTYVRGAVVSGRFDPNALLMWINKDYCKNGYAYLTPFNEKKASLILVVTDIVEKQIDEFWELFLYTENLDYKIIEEYKLEHKTGFVYPHRLNNLYFSGNAGGGIDPFLGFGQMNSLMQGVFAAKSIVLGKDYEKLIKKLEKNNKKLHEFRKAFNQLTNWQYDLLVRSIDLPGIKQLLYFTQLNVVNVGGSLLGLKNKISTKGRKKN